MLKRARILLVGTCAATALSSAAASSQPAPSRIDNSQFSLGDVFAGQTLNVIDPLDGVAVTTGASGNAASVQSEAHDATVNSLQLTRNVQADTDLTVRGYSPATHATTVAAGNGLHGSVDGAAYTASTDQVVGQATDGPLSRIQARTRVAAELSSSGDHSALSAAVGNDQSTAVDGGPVDVRSGQYHYGAGTSARTEASLFHVQGQADLTAVAAANQHVAETSADDVRFSAAQVSTGATEASVVATVDNGYLVNGFASSAANSVSLANQGVSTAADVTQAHDGYVRAESAVYVGQFGGATSTAHGVGNTVSAVAYGQALTLDTDQLNSGGVDAVASFGGYEGYEADVNASATGNMVSAQACSDCDGSLDAVNTQMNTGAVTAQVRTDMTGGAFRSTATATGNSASFVVSRPSH